MLSEETQIGSGFRGLSPSFCSRLRRELEEGGEQCFPCHLPLSFMRSWRRLWHGLSCQGSMLETIIYLILGIRCLEAVPIRNKEIVPFSVSAVVLDQGQFCPPASRQEDSWRCLETTFWLSHLKGEWAAIGIYWAQARNAAGTLQCTG